MTRKAGTEDRWLPSGAPLLLVGLCLLGFHPAQGQSSWTPDVRRSGGGSEFKIPDPNRDLVRDHRLARFHSDPQVSSVRLSTADHDSLRHWFLSHSIKDLHEWMGSIALDRDKESSLLTSPQTAGRFDLPRPEPASSSAAPGWALRLAASSKFRSRLDQVLDADDANARDRLLSTGAGFPLPGPHWSLVAYRTRHHVALDQLNATLIGYELNEVDRRNHREIHNTDGFGLALDRAVSPRFGWHNAVEVVGGRTTDRQTWAQTDAVTGAESYPRDEQRVEMDGIHLLTAVSYKSVVRDVELGLTVGPALEINRLRVRYWFDGTEQYDVKSDRASMPGLRFAGHMKMPLSEPFFLSGSAGYKLVQDRELSIGSGAWFWHSGPAAAEPATLDTDGAYVALGLGVRF